MNNSTVFARSDAAATISFISLCNFVWLLFESGYYSTAAFIKFGTEDEEIHAVDTREAIRKDIAVHACHCNGY